MRMPQILKVMPVSKSELWLMVQKGEFSKPIKIGMSSFMIIEQVQAYLRGGMGHQLKYRDLPGFSSSFMGISSIIWRCI
jgi:prophage regulatory protein